MLFKLNADKWHIVDGQTVIDKCFFRSKTEDTPKDEILLVFRDGFLDTKDTFIIETLQKAKFCTEVKAEVKEIKEVKNENKSTGKL